MAVVAPSQWMVFLTAGETTREAVWEGPFAELANSATPVRVDGLPPLDRIVNTGGYYCGFQMHGVLWCWGEGNPGYFPNDMVPDLPAVFQIPGVDDIIDLAVGQDSFCVIHGDSTVECFGDGPLKGWGGNTFEWEGHPIDDPDPDPDYAYNPCDCKGRP